jgi:hypothetical protein
MTTPGMQGEVSPESMRETGLQPSKARPTRNRPLSQLLGDTAEQSRLKPCRGSRSSYQTSWNWKVKKEIPVWLLKVCNGQFSLTLHPKRAY